MKKVAVIGLGDISKVHIPLLEASDYAEIVALCDICQDKKLNHNSIPFFTNVEQMLSEVKVDVAHICLPHNLHYRVARLCLEKGVDVFCEKPLALNLDEAIKFSKMEQEFPDRYIGLCMQNRYNNTSVKLKEIVMSSEYGALRGVYAQVPWYRNKEYYDVAPWRGLWSEAGGGVLNNQSIHTLDLMQWIFGDICSLKGNVFQVLDYGIEVEDTATASIEYTNGAKGLFFATNANVKNENVNITATFEKAVLIIENNRLFLVDEENEKHFICEDQRLDGTKFYYGAGHKIAIDEFYSSYKTGVKTYIPVGDGVIGMKLIDAIRKSTVTGKVIKIKE